MQDNVTARFTCRSCGNIFDFHFGLSRNFEVGEAIRITALNYKFLGGKDIVFDTDDLCDAAVSGVVKTLRVSCTCPNCAAGEEKKEDTQGETMGPGADEMEPVESFRAKERELCERAWRRERSSEDKVRMQVIGAACRVGPADSDSTPIVVLPPDDGE